MVQLSVGERDRSKGIAEDSQEYKANLVRKTAEDSQEYKANLVPKTAEDSQEYKANLVPKTAEPCTKNDKVNMPLFIPSFPNSLSFIAVYF
ncbi:MAG: hypothetical protein DRR19_08785 [Candidatus Parabeggiatoa sp. nov. 1]|nr:MAG: hypothetical protein DRR19_08785 [Gammaproteobacteria bacterium]